MKAFELTAKIDKKRILQIEVPKDISPGKVRLILLIPEEDDAGRAWMHGVAREWKNELADLREDIYTLDDGEPVDGTE